MVHKILVVDENLTFLDLMKIVLKANGYSVQTAPNCRIAKELIERWKPNLIILDSNINDRKASGFIEEIRISSNIPIFLFTTTDNYLNALACLDAGANDGISKPVSISELLAKVNAFKHGLALPNHQYLVTHSIKANSIVEE